MALLSLKALLFSLLNTFGLSSPTPDIIDLAIISRQVSHLQTFAQIIKSHEMAISMQKICKTQLSQEFIQIMQSPSPQLDEFTAEISPFICKISQEKKYQQLCKNINVFLDSEKGDLEKYENFYGDQAQQLVHRILIEQLNQAATFGRNIYIREDQSLRNLINLTILFTDLARMINSKKDKTEEAIGALAFTWQILYFLKFINEINIDSCISFDQGFCMLRNLSKAALNLIEELNKKIEILDSICNNTERHVFLNELKQMNTLTRAMLNDLIQFVK